MHRGFKKSKLSSCRDLTPAEPCSVQPNVSNTKISTVSFSGIVKDWKVYIACLGLLYSLTTLTIHVVHIFVKVQFIRNLLILIAEIDCLPVCVPWVLSNLPVNKVFWQKDPERDLLKGFFFLSLITHINVTFCTAQASYTYVGHLSL